MIAELTPGLSTLRRVGRRWALDSRRRAANNSSMNIPGRVHNGVVVLEDASALPEAPVTVTFPACLKPSRRKKNGTFSSRLSRQASPARWT